MNRIRILPLFLGLLAFCFQPVANGEDWRNLVQPIGTLVIVETAATVNTRLGGNPPFDTATDVTTITTGTPQYFVRFYNPSDGTYPSNAVGSWLMRAATVRGLTPAQVRDVFALPALPTHMTMVLVPSGYKMYTGIAAPIAGWGGGGAQQSKLIGPPWVDSDNFFNRQPVMDTVLSYRILAPGGNAGRIATYLDIRIPAAYSDLEKVYLSLDLLYSAAGASGFRDALEQIGPTRYDHLAANVFYTGLRFNQAVDDHLFALFYGGGARPSPPVVLAGFSWGSSKAASISPVPAVMRRWPMAGWGDMPPGSALRFSFRRPSTGASARPASAGPSCFPPLPAPLCPSPKPGRQMPVYGPVSCCPSRPSAWCPRPPSTIFTSTVMTSPNPGPTASA